MPKHEIVHLKILVQSTKLLSEHVAKIFIVINLPKCAFPTYLNATVSWQKKKDTSFPAWGLFMNLIGL